MTRSRIAWYVHHHGSGHLGRLLSIAEHLDADVICFSSLAAPPSLPAHVTWVQLERDDTEQPEGPRHPTVDGLLHWAPLHHPGHRGRLAVIAAEIDRAPVTAFVVDVSVEVSLFARLLGIPVILLTQPGLRIDEPHDLAFRCAALIIAPWPKELLEPEHLRHRPVVYVGGISRFDGREVPADARSGVLVLSGAGGTDITGASIAAASEATPNWEWRALGISGHGRPGWVNDPWDELVHAEIVVAFAGQNSVADLAVAGARAIVIPQERPFEEQRETAAALGRAGLAVTEPSWPVAERWPELLERARALRPEWSRWGAAGAAARAADAILATAEGRQ